MKSSEIPYHLAMRFAASPIMLPFFLFYLLPYDFIVLNILLVIAFIAMRFSGLSIDRLAKLCQVDQVLYKDLASVADLCFMYSVLLVLVAVQRVYFYWMVILLGIDFFILGSRSLAACKGFTIEVSYYVDKARTLAMVSWLAVKIIDASSHAQGSFAFMLFGLELAFLWTTLGLSVALARQYFDKMYAHRCAGHGADGLISYEQQQDNHHDDH